jgi:hypothetical protein
MACLLFDFFESGHRNSRSQEFFGGRFFALFAISQENSIFRPKNDPPNWPDFRPKNRLFEAPRPGLAREGFWGGCPRPGLARGGVRGGSSPARPGQGRGLGGKFRPGRGSGRGSGVRVGGPGRKFGPGWRLPARSSTLRRGTCATS